jgi:hypothetical protein
MLFYEFISGGCVSIIQNWILKGFDTPIDEIINNIKTFINIFEKNIF